MTLKAEIIGEEGIEYAECITAHDYHIEGESKDQ